MSGPRPPGSQPLREVLARHGLRPRKALGQHFLLDPAICARIAACAGDLSGRHVLEVGPGPGGLTRALLATPLASLTAIELDPRAVAALGEIADPRLTVLQRDALGFDGAKALPAPRQVVANLPYNIGTPLLLGWLRQAGAWERLTLMFQQEVAERITAAPGTAAYGRLSVLCQWLCRCRVLMHLPPGAFFPPPAVHSAVVGLEPRPEQPSAPLLAAMERLTAAAFGQRRKMLRASLRPLGAAEALLAAAGIAGDRRGETLSVEEFATLARHLAERG
ncbi:MAG: 16S rRNA (adenine(1518)-N(6)/adenine(1519)-N(6))-dimethyltransferase RsmA [Rhodovarius sp.]|nr:16S rRNA (adenine(1518)-N(6)/adenine(1519)-N(6))-dimethyltransferase RsmA [Rhodovarius sp.]MCX7933565.1 16S rRNA (adenine(1518)-N(6)/adenine(1519)-N(6))-dimethyltransferase RsmA [Rhodovarius sp.]MDW8313714.1 16S rRNA (adenine(1518)-N(6)/adenine(1519)-N(6))-dimethyltransferase RsmA [Rhodovarius sp.]